MAGLTVKVFGGALKFRFSGQDGDNRRMGTDKCTLIALDAVVHDPFRDVDCNPALLIFCRIHREDAVRLEGAYRQGVSLLGKNRAHDIFDIIGLIGLGLLFGNGTLQESG